MCLKLTKNDYISSINWYQNLRKMKPKLNSYEECM